MFTNAASENNNSGLLKQNFLGFFFWKRNKVCAIFTYLEETLFVPFCCIPKCVTVINVSLESQEKKLCAKRLLFVMFI